MNGVVSPWRNYYPNDVQLLPDGTDLNSVTENGKWILNASYTYTNNPAPGMTVWLEVANYTPDGLLMQRVTDFGGRFIIMRGYNATGWLTWHCPTPIDLGNVDQFDAPEHDTFCWLIWDYLRKNMPILSLIPNYDFIMSGNWKNVAGFSINGTVFYGSSIGMNIRTSLHDIRMTCPIGPTASWTDVVKWHNRYIDYVSPVTVNSDVFTIYSGGAKIVNNILYISLVLKKLVSGSIPRDIELISAGVYFEADLAFTQQRSLDTDDNQHIFLWLKSDSGKIQFMANTDANQIFTDTYYHLNASVILSAVY